jgi:hypothetical protein
VQQRCAAAFIEGLTLVPEDTRLTFRPAGTQASPIARERLEGGGFAFAGTTNGHGWLIALGVRDAGQVPLERGWRRERRVANRPGVQVWTVER